ncbi:MAG: DUF362 domain-containing protein [Paludibacteraceae bacterium]|nr:DUF362 domain-containing protein [Paludibacteraceae bacterium]
MNKLFFSVCALCVSLSVSAQSDVYFTSDLSNEGLMKIYHCLSKQAFGKVALKISTGESSKTYYLRPEYIKPLVDETNATIVECNTAYGGNRATTAKHRAAIKERGFDQIATVDIMDEEDTMRIPVVDTKHIQYNIVGSHLSQYDFMINLAHFKGHAMGGFGGVLKNASIGVAAQSGKCYIHTAGYSQTSAFGGRNTQDDFLESMAAAAQAVHNYFQGNIVYINVMNNLSVDCDCMSNPSSPEMSDIGILASTDPVALDKACLDLVFNHDNTTGNTSVPLQNRINSLHGTWTVEYAEKIGLGTQSYNLIDVDNTNDVEEVRAGQAGTPLFNVYTLDGKRLLSRVESLEGLEPGVYVVNGRIMVISAKNK